MLKIAENNFMSYVMKVTYGDIKDRIYNTQNANIWNQIILNLNKNNEIKLHARVNSN